MSETVFTLSECIICSVVWVSGVTYEVGNLVKVGDARVQHKRVEAVPAVERRLDRAVVVLALRHVALDDGERLFEFGLLGELRELSRRRARKRHDIACGKVRSAL